MALLNARSADTGKRNARRTQQSAAINLSPSRGIAEGSTQHTEHRRGAAIPSSEADSEVLTKSTQRKEIPSSLAVDMPLLPIRARAHTHTSPPGKCSRVLGATPQEKEAGEKYHAGGGSAVAGAASVREESRGSSPVRLLHFAITWSSRSSCSRVCLWPAAPMEPRGRWKRTKRVAHCVHLTATPSGDDGLARATACY